MASPRCQTRAEGCNLNRVGKLASGPPRVKASLLSIVLLAWLSQPALAQTECTALLRIPGLAQLADAPTSLTAAEALATREERTAGRGLGRAFREPPIGRYLYNKEP